MYVMRSNNGFYTLTEMTERELRRAEFSKQDSVGYEICTASEAHAWVKKDGHHETALYVDDTGRVRKAKDTY